MIVRLEHSQKCRGTTPCPSESYWMRRSLFCAVMNGLPGHRRLGSNHMTKLSCIFAWLSLPPYTKGSCVEICPAVPVTSVSWVEGHIYHGARKPQVICLWERDSRKSVKLSRLTGTAVLRAAWNIEHATLGCCEPHARHYGKSRESLHRLTWHTPCVSSSKAVVKQLGGGETGVKGSHSTAIVTVTSKQTQLPRNSTCPWDFRATISSRYPKLECPKWQF